MQVLKYLAFFPGGLNRQYIKNAFIRNFISTEVLIKNLSVSFTHLLDLHNRLPTTFHTSKLDVVSLKSVAIVWRISKKRKCWRNKQKRKCFECQEVFVSRGLGCVYPRSICFSAVSKRRFENMNNYSLLF